MAGSPSCSTRTQVPSRSLSCSWQSLPRGGCLAWEGSGRKATEDPSAPSPILKHLPLVLPHPPTAFQYPGALGQGSGDVHVECDFCGAINVPPLPRSPLCGTRASPSCPEGSKRPNSTDCWVQPPSPHLLHGASVSFPVSCHKISGLMGPSSSSHHCMLQRQRTAA